MTLKVAAIVEGDGEVIALPVLLRRLSEWKTPEIYVDVLAPIRVRRDRFLRRPEEFQRILSLAASKCGDNGWILIILDADDDCPKETGADILANASAHIPHRNVSVVLANREYEAWFIAAASSLDGCRGFNFSQAIVNAESPRDAKGWIERQMSGSYSEITDQPAFSAKMDLQEAFDRSRSFRKLCSEWTKSIAALTAGRASS